MSRTRVALTVPAKSEYLLLARLVVLGLARGRELDDETVADLKLAVTEAAGNAVRHAYDDGNGTVALTYELRDGTIEIVVEDQGAGFHTDGPEWPTGEQEDGMGLAIIDAIADELEVGPCLDGIGTRVRFTRKLRSSDHRSSASARDS